MIEPAKTGQSEIICYCSGTKRQEIEKLIAHGEKDLERISRITGALSGCGGCEFEMRKMLPEQN